MTIRVSEKAKKQAMDLYAKTDTTSSFSSFIGDMVAKGIEVEEIWRIKQKEFMGEFVKQKIDFDRQVNNSPKKKTGTEGK
jgi:hypothetical protein